MDAKVHEKIAELTRRINELARQQTTISNQLLQLINELEALKSSLNASAETTPVIPERPVQPPVQRVVVNEVIEPVPQTSTVPSSPVNQPPFKPATTFEEFIGKKRSQQSRYTGYYHRYFYRGQICY